MRVLVTGASGMLGAGVARALAARGDDVTVLQRRPAGLELREVLADVADAQAVRRATAGQDAVVHLAAKVSIAGAEAEFRAANITGTAAVVAGCRANGVGRLVHVSSPSVAHAGSSIVGEGARPADPVGARGPYARTKAAAELIALRADDVGLAVVAVRPHLVWGPGDTQLIGRVVQRASVGRLPLIGTGGALVDTTYASNAVGALIAALDRCDKAHGQALVVSNGEPRPIAELLGAICRAAGVPAPRHHVPRSVASGAGWLAEQAWSLAARRRGSADQEPPLTRFLVEQLSTAHWFDQRETRQVLAWQPRIGLDEGFNRLTRWFQPEAQP